jgi:hypothetical protein
MSTADFEAQRIAKIAEEGIRRSYDDEDAPDDLRLDSFVIVATWAWTDEDGDEREGTGVWSEARRHYAKLGMLHNGIDAVKEAFGDA